MAGDDGYRAIHGPLTPLERDRLDVHAPRAAVALLGVLLVRERPGATPVIARIVETEAYREDDPASHSHAGRTRRTEPMFWGPGTSYVYRSYGVHWCLNVVAEAPGTGAAVLLRAATVIEGAATVADRHPTPGRDTELLRGPGRLTRGLDLDAPRHDRGDLILGVHGLRLADDGWRPEPEAVRCGPRVGVSRAAQVPWRFLLADATEVSAYRRSPRRAGRSSRERS